MPHSFNAAARVFCREAADPSPTTNDAVACPYFSGPAMRCSGSSAMLAAAALRSRLPSLLGQSADATPDDLVGLQVLGRGL
ncbi:hypothetical protein ACGFNP_19705 [Nonomuraea sp. NPDC049269]|uniref:hypothetical protein n=1 Tax=Nonomuraea sp. NPDC049269 TaxID=3364349 RepID=UPI00371A959A